MTVHTDEDLRRLARLARREFSLALMSDTKWRKLLAAVDEAGLGPADHGEVDRRVGPPIFVPPPLIDCDRPMNSEQ